MKKAKWNPDTCECSVEEICECPDDGPHTTEHVVVQSNTLHKCDAHLIVSDEELYGILYANPDGENKVKNMTLSELSGHYGNNYGLHDEKVNNGKVIKTFKEGIECKWSFIGTGKNRELQVTIEGATLTEQQKTNLKKILKEKFGKDKIKL